METPSKILKKKHLHNLSEISTPLKIPPSPLLKTLGYGTGVTVLQLNRSPIQGKIRSPWAVKKMSKKARERGDKVYESRLQAEAVILRKLEHPNIVGFRAFKNAAEGSLLALEFCHTSLGTILEDRFENELGPLPSELTLKMCLDISKALDYIHNNAKLLHADIKSFNILVKNEFEICKLCDFGVSIPLDENGNVDFIKNPHLEYIGTELWSAPEVINGEIEINDKADIFSFGLVIYETIALIAPHTLNMIDNDNNDSEDFIKLEDFQKLEESKELQDSIDSEMEIAYGTRPPLPNTFTLTYDYNQIVELFYICTSELAEDRPSAKLLSSMISKIV